MEPQIVTPSHSGDKRTTQDQEMILPESLGDDNRLPSPPMVSEEERRILRDKMKEMFAKIITDIDKQVLTVSESQSELDSQLDRLISTLDSIKIDEKLTDEISANANRITSLKSRLTLIHTILSNSSARCSRTLAACGAAVSSLNSHQSSVPPSPSPKSVNAPHQQQVTGEASSPATQQH